MFKHSNTFAPGDRVRRTKNGVKLAGDSAIGEVQGVSDDAQTLKVRFEDGSTDYVRPEELSEL